jgi:hypothetical protein
VRARWSNSLRNTRVTATVGCEPRRSQDEFRPGLSAVAGCEAAGAEEATAPPHCQRTGPSAGADGGQRGVELRVRARLVGERAEAEVADTHRRMDKEGQARIR